MVPIDDVYNTPLFRLLVLVPGSHGYDQALINIAKETQVFNTLPFI